MASLSDLHLLPNNDEGHAMIHQLQQRAEAWAEAVCVLRCATTTPPTKNLSARAFATWSSQLTTIVSAVFIGKIQLT
jgi:hypothetical protein